MSRQSKWFKAPIFGEPRILIPHGERREASNRPFASIPPRNSRGLRDIWRLADQVPSHCAAPPEIGFAGDHPLGQRCFELPSNRLYREKERPPETARADGQEIVYYRTSPEVLLWNPSVSLRHGGCE